MARWGSRIKAFVTSSKLWAALTWAANALRSHRGPPWRPGPRGRAVIITFIVVFVIGEFDILGIETALEPLSNTITARVLAPLYPRISEGAAGPDKSKAAKITVVLIDKAYMSLPGSKKRSWPLAANDFLINVLRPITREKPKTVFIDVTFTDMPRAVSPHGPVSGTKGIEALGRGIANASQTVPIYVSTTYPIEEASDAHCPADRIDADAIGNADTLSRDFRRAAFAHSDAAHPPQLEVTTARWLGAGYPFGAALVASQHNCVVRHARAGANGTVSGIYLLTPAAAIFARLCEERHGGKCPDIERLNKPNHDNGTARYALSASLQGRMRVRWGSRQSDLMHRYFSDAPNADLCFAQDSRPLPLEWLLQALFAIFPVLDNQFGGPLRRCPFVDTVTVDQIRHPTKYGLTRAEAARFRHDFLYDRIVMIGTQLPYVPDIISSPVNGEVPGVYEHAMALSNLITYGRNFSRMPDDWSDLVEAVLEAIMAAALAFTVPLAFKGVDARLLRIGDGARRPGPRHFLVFHVAVVIVLIVVLIVVMAIVYGIGLVARDLANALDVMLITLAVMVAVMDDLQRMLFAETEEEKPETGPPLEPQPRLDG